MHHGGDISELLVQGCVFVVKGNVVQLFSQLLADTSGPATHLIVVELNLGLAVLKLGQVSAQMVQLTAQSLVLPLI